MSTLHARFQILQHRAELCKPPPFHVWRAVESRSGIRTRKVLQELGALRLDGLPVVRVERRRRFAEPAWV
eukprot:8640584-Alexandrium_andersonii.AAC.1